MVPLWRCDGICSMNGWAKRNDRTEWRAGGKPALHVGHTAVVGGAGACAAHTSRFVRKSRAECVELCPEAGSFTGVRGAMPAKPWT